MTNLYDDHPVGSTSQVTANQPQDPLGRVVSTAAGARSRAWVLTLVLVALYTLNYGDKVVLGVVVQPLREEYGYSASQIGLAGSAFFLAMTASGFLTGTIKRYVSLRWALAILALAWALCMLPVVVAGSFAVLLVSRFMLGLFEGPSSALIHTAAYSWHPVSRRALPGACIASAAALSKILLAPALGYLAVTLGWRSAFIALALGSLVWVAIWLATWRPGPYGDEAEASTAEEGREVVARKSATRWRDVIATRTFLGGAVAVFSFYTLSSVVLTWLPSYFEIGLGYTRLQSTTLFGVPSMVALVALFSTTFVADRLMTRGVSSRIHRGILPGLGLLVCGAAMLSVPAIDDRRLVVVVISIGYGLGTMVYPLLNAAISEIAPPDKLAGALGLFLALMTTGGLIGPYVSGWIVDHADDATSGYNTVFMLLGALTTVGAAAALIFVNARRDSAQIASATERRLAKP